MTPSSGSGGRTGSRKEDEGGGVARGTDDAPRKPTSCDNARESRFFDLPLSARQSLPIYSAKIFNNRTLLCAGELIYNMARKMLDAKGILCRCSRMNEYEYEYSGGILAMRRKSEGTP